MGSKDLVFVNGIVKSREKTLIPYDKFVQMADSSTADEAMKILSEYGFGESGFSADEYDKLAESERRKFGEFLAEYCPYPSFYADIVAKDDFFNAECAVRQKYLGTPDDIFSSDGAFGISALKAALGGGKTDVPEYLVAPMREAEKLFEDGKATGAAVGTIFLRAYYGYMLKTVKSRDWREIIICEIDAKNLSVALRSSDKNAAAATYIGGGRVTRSVLDLLVAREDRKAFDKLARTPYYDLVKLGASERAAGEPLVEFEREAENFAMKKLKEKRFESEGITPLLLYSYYKINEIKNVRLVMAMKVCGADKDSIKRRLRDCYGK